MEEQLIRPDMNIQEIMDAYPGIGVIFMGYGLHCTNCMAAGFDTLEQGAMIHGFTQETFDMMMRDANTLALEITQGKTKSETPQSI